MLAAAPQRNVNVPNWERLMSEFQGGPASSTLLRDALWGADFLGGPTN